MTASDPHRFADGDDLVVFWIKKYHDASIDDYINKIYGYRIQDAATRTDAVNFQEVSEYLAEGDDLGMISTDWDPDINVNTARIAWTKKEGGNYNTYAARVTFHPETNQPDGVAQRYKIFDGTRDALNPKIVVNHNNPQGEMKEAFCSFTSDNKFKRVDLEVIDGVDYWQTPVNVIDDDISDQEANITYREFGNPRHIWINQGIHTESEKIENGGIAAKLCTNRDNKRDIYSAYRWERERPPQYNMVIIRQLEP